MSASSITAKSTTDFISVTTCLTVCTDSTAFPPGVGISESGGFFYLTVAHPETGAISAVLDTQSLDWLCHRIAQKIESSNDAMDLFRTLRSGSVQ